MIRSESLQAYFREALSQALGRTAVSVSPEAQVYMVRMLLDFSRSEHAFSGVDHGEEPIYALLLSRALESEPQEALRLYKQVGDSVLYQMGFFREFSAQKLPSESYYYSVGESAYSSASNLSRPMGLSAAMIYGELADRFIDLVFVFNEISVHGERNSDRGGISTERMLALIELYRRTNSPQVRDILIRQGVSLEPDLKKT